MVNRPAEVSPGAKCVVDNDRNTSLVRNCYNLLKIGNIVPWVANAFKLAWVNHCSESSSRKLTYIEVAMMLSPACARAAMAMN